MPLIHPLNLSSPGRLNGWDLLIAQVLPWEEEKASILPMAALWEGFPTGEWRGERERGRNLVSERLSRFDRSRKEDRI